MTKKAHEAWLKNHVKNCIRCNHHGAGYGIQIVFHLCEFCYGKWEKEREKYYNSIPAKDFEKILFDKKKKSEVEDKEDILFLKFVEEAQ